MSFLLIINIFSDSEGYKNMLINVTSHLNLPSLDSVSTGLIRNLTMCLRARSARGFWTWSRNEEQAAEA